MIPASGLAAETMMASQSTIPVSEQGHSPPKLVQKGTALSLRALAAKHTNWTNRRGGFRFG